MIEATRARKFSVKREGDEIMILVVRGTRSSQEVGSSRIDDSPEEQQPRQTAECTAVRGGKRLG